MIDCNDEKPLITNLSYLLKTLLPRCSVHNDEQFEIVKSPFPLLKLWSSISIECSDVNSIISKLSMLSILYPPSDILSSEGRSNRLFKI